MAEPEKSTGPQGTDETDSPKKPVRDDSDLTIWRFFGMGIQLAVTVALFAALGLWLDGKFGWTPWGLIGFGLLGVTAGMYQFLKAAL